MLDTSQCRYRAVAKARMQVVGLACAAVCAAICGVGVIIMHVELAEAVLPTT